MEMIDRIRSVLTKPDKDIAYLLMQALYVFFFTYVSMSGHENAGIVMVFIAVLMRIEAVDYKISKKE